MKILLTLILAAILVSAAIAGVSAAPWLPTKKRQRNALADHLSIAKNAICYDLGCGDGAVLFSLATKFPEASFIGYDISLFPLFLAWIKKLFRRKTAEHISFRFGNLFKKNVSNADVVFIFLLKKSYPRLLQKLKKELKDDAIIVVEAWPFEGIEPEQIIKEEGLLTMYVYQANSIRE